MTIETEAARSAALVAAGDENAPFFLWNNLIDTITAPDGEEPDGAAANAISGTTYDYARPTTDAGTARLAFTATGALSCVGVAAHNISSIGGTLVVQYSDDGGTVWATVDSVTPATNEAILLRFTEQTHDDWRVIVTGISTNQLQVAVLFAGVEMLMPKRIYQGYTPPLQATQVNMTPRMTEGGNFRGSKVIARGSLSQADFEHLPDSFVRGSDFQGFMQHHNEGGAYFWAWRPAKYGDAFYAWSSGQPIIPTNAGPLALMSCVVQMRMYHDY